MNFYNIKEYIQKFNEKYEELYKNRYSFEKKTILLMKLFNPEKNIIKSIKSKIKENLSKEKTLILKINDNYYLKNLSKSKKIELKYYNYNGNFNTTCSIDYNEKIFSLSNSIENKQIYACLSRKRKINIFDYNLEQKLIKLCNYQIEDDMNLGKHFNKCIDISNKFLASCDEDMIYIWRKEKLNLKTNTNDDAINKINEINYTFQNIKRIILNKKTTDLLLVNNKYFISSQPNNNSISFIDINNLEVEKIISNIDCIDSTNCLLLFNSFIIICCMGGIAIISINTKELIQYFSLINEIKYRRICCGYNSFFILDSYENKGIKISELNINENCFEFFGIHEDKQFKQEQKADIFLMNKKDLILASYNLNEIGEESESENNEEDSEYDNEDN